MIHTESETTPVLGVTTVSTRKRNRKTPAVNATFRIDPSLKAWLEWYADARRSTVTAVVTEQLEQLQALTRITNHIRSSMLRNMKRYERAKDFIDAMMAQNIKPIAAWDDSGTMEGAVQRLAWDTLLQWLKQDPAERDVWLRIAVEGAEYWTHPESLSGNLFEGSGT